MSGSLTDLDAPCAVCDAVKMKIYGIGRGGKAALDDAARRHGRAAPTGASQLWHCTRALYAVLEADIEAPFVIYFGVLMTPAAFTELTGSPPLPR